MASGRTKRDSIIADLSARLARVCEHMTDEEFARLVVDMADTKLRFAVIDAGAWGRRSRHDGPTSEGLNGPPADL